MMDRMERDECEVVNFKTLPEGAYEVQIINAKVETFSNGGQGIKLQFDITRGEYSGFYNEQYSNSTFDNKKWKGVVTLFLADKASPYYDTQRKKFWRNITAIEDLNPGFKFNDLSQIESFKAKKAIVLVANKKWDYNGKSGITPTPHSFIYSNSYNDESYRETLEFINDKIKGSQTPPPIQAPTVNMEEFIALGESVPF